MSRSRAVQPPCLYCGNIFRGQNIRKYCSALCRRRAANGTPANVAGRMSAIANCLECGEGFERARRINQEYCCRACQKRASDRKRTAIRRAITRGVGAERFDPTLVLERDGWRCQLCGRKTPKRLRGTCDSRAPVLDHIVPLAAGGDHSMKNTQCLCFGCNTAKGAAAIGQLRLFG